VGPLYAAIGQNWRIGVLGKEIIFSIPLQTMKKSGLKEPKAVQV
jgi:hypothetical protein